MDTVREGCITVLQHQHLHLQVCSMGNSGETAKLTTCVQKLLFQLCTVNVTR